MNVSQLQPHPPSQVQQSSRNGEEKDGDFLALRLLNKRARVRLSPRPLNLEPLPGRGVLLAVANHVGLFAAATVADNGQNGVIVSSLEDLRATFLSSKADGEIPFTPKRTVLLDSPANTIAFACRDSRLLASLTNGTIVVYDTAAVATPGTDPVKPLHVFTSPRSTPVRELAVNPGDIPELVAVLYEHGGSSDGHPVELLDIQKLQVVGAWKSGGTPQTTPTSLSWSPKGKQVAIGLENGDIVTFGPSDTSHVKSMAPKPSSLSSHSLLSTTWLSNTDFHCIYVPDAPLQPDSEQTHHIITLDSKANTAVDTTLNAPYLPYPGMRNPGSFITVLRYWDPSKFLLFIGDSTSSDIGLIGCFVDSGQEKWANISLEETSTPAVPLDKEMNDTVLLGLVIDLTHKDSYTHKTASGEDAVLPPPPIMLAYASDGTITGWHILNTQGSPYPGMVSTTAPGPVASTPEATMLTPTEEKPVESTFNQPSTWGVKMTPLFNQPATPTPAQPVSVFGQPGSGSTFGQSSFGQPSAFGQSAFSQPAGFGSTTPAFGTTIAPSTAGFGAFASAQPSKFGQPTLAIGTSSSTLVPPAASSPAASPMTISMSTSEDPMAADSEIDNGVGGGLGGLSLGGGTSDKSKSEAGATGLFGSFQPVSSAPGSSDSNKPATSFGAFGTGTDSSKPSSGFGTYGGGSQPGFLKPATGFGMLPASNSSFGGAPPGTATDANKSSASVPAFGTAGFGSATSSATPTFGQGGFGAKPAFGQSGFGQSGFGQSSFGSGGTKPTSTVGSANSGTSGGFAAFANSGTTGFGSAVKKDVAEPSKLSPGGGFAAFANNGTSSFGSALKKEVTEPAKHEPTASSPAALVSADTSKSTFGAPNSEPSRSTPFMLPTTTSDTMSPKEEPSTASAFSLPSGSAFKTTTLAPASGAFAGLTSSATGFGKLDSGFGAFGSGVSSSSPFYSPKPAVGNVFGGSTPAFATTPSTPPSTGTGKPTFGAPSTFGAAASGNAAKSAFGKSAFSTTPTTSPTGAAQKPVNTTPTTGGFSAFAGAGNFGSTASSGKSFSELLKSDTDMKAKSNEDTPKQAPSTPVSVFSRPPPTSSGSSASVFATPTKPTTSKDSTTPKTPETPRDDEKGDSEGDSQELPSSSEDGDDDADETGSFLSENFSDEESDGEEREDDDEEEEEGGDDDDDDDEEDASKPPVIRLTSSSPPNSPESYPKKRIPVRERSTTPPGSPVKQPSPPPVASPKPIPAASRDSRIGLGRPSTKPTRSSPLAGAVISGDDDDEEEETVVQPKSSSPVAGTTPTMTQSKSPSPVPGKPSRPSTPPLLSTLSAPVVVPRPKTPDVVTPPPEKATSGPTTPSPGSIFAQKTPPPRPESAPVSVFSGPFANLGKPSAPVATSAPPPQPPAFNLPSTKPPTLGLPETQPPVPSPSLFAKPPATPASTPPAQSSQPSLFGQKASFPPLPQGGLFGQKLGSNSNQANTQSQAGPPPAIPAPGGFLGMKPPPFNLGSPVAQPTNTFSPGLFGGQSIAPPFSPAVAPANPEKGASAGVEEPMQKECLNLFSTLARELEGLRRLTDVFQAKRTQYYRPMGGARITSDLGDPSKFGVGDAIEFGQLLLSLEKEIADLKELRVAHKKVIRELENAMLKANMRKEEVVRFSKANSDAEFAKMLKARTLGPEHLETQTQLRRGLRVIQDRVQKLENHIQASKKRLAQMKIGKPGLRPPSLDTINRTYRNIDIAIAQQAEDVNALTSRVSKLKLKDLRAAPRQSLGSQSFLEDRGSGTNRRPLTVTPNVAATTAAALNAERAAQKLKGALLRARKEPLLNTQSAEAPPPPSFPETQAKTNSTPTPSDSGPSTTPWTLPPFRLPDAPASETGTGAGRHRGAGAKPHKKLVVPLKKSTGQVFVSSSSPATGPPGFSWGPLPSTVPKSTKGDPPVSSLPVPLFGLRK